MKRFSAERGSAERSSGTTVYEMQGDPAAGDERLLRQLYPFVDETKTPLPRQWSSNSNDKNAALGISHSNLKVTYRGQGKNHKDAAAVRSNVPIPAACGLYYFEVRILSKGRDGYMGIGLCQRDVNTNRLPGWDRCSYGYHGDDGNFFCSSGSGVPYGPTFTTGDVIGCGLNLVDSSCFYTKNGQNLGTAFTDLPGDLYPTVGLQTPGEAIDTNFGQFPFVYDVYDEIREAQSRVKASILRYSLPSTKNEWFNKLVSSYLVHHGYCASAESFNGITGQSFSEEAASIRNRQEVRRLILDGRISDATNLLSQLYPGLLERNPQLLFTLKCRQFVEMVAGVDTDSVLSKRSSPPHDSPSRSPPSFQQQRGGLPYAKPSKSSPGASPRDSPRRYKSRSSRKSPSPHQRKARGPVEEAPGVRDVQNGTSSRAPVCSQEDVVMDSDYLENGSAKVENGAGPRKELMEEVKNGASDVVLMDSDDTSSGSCYSGHGSVSVGNQGSKESTERLLRFGRDLLSFSNQLKIQPTPKIMNEAFSLIAYADPRKSSLGYLLDQSQRLPVAAAVNSAILEDQGYNGRPALEAVYSHVRRLRQEMAASGVGAAAFADPIELCQLKDDPEIGGSS